MRMQANPIEEMAKAIHETCFVHAKDVVYSDRDWDIYRATKQDVRIKKVRRPIPTEVEVIGMFRQQWGSTALGFGGLGGQAITDAYTYITKCNGEYFVYFAGMFAYKVSNPTPMFFDHITDRKMLKVADHATYEA